uniref:Putative ovule protein n=1 Tax=Solanum chacoense TaxID=4108 RepID=A0A0V0H6E3_SOLCH
MMSTHWLPHLHLHHLVLQPQRLERRGTIGPIWRCRHYSCGWEVLARVQRSARGSGSDVHLRRPGDNEDARLERFRQQVAGASSSGHYRWCSPNCNRGTH